MKVIVVVKQGRGGSGVSQATHYIANRERDEAREGPEPRRLFSAREERLSYTQANRVLGAGTEPLTKDVLHLVISLAHEGDFHALGHDEESRQQAVRKITRRTIAEMAQQLKAEELRWVAGIHRNTDNPHVHLLIHRDYVDRETGRGKRLKKLPKEMRVSWERTPDGERQTNPGTLSLTFEKHLAEQLERSDEARLREDWERRHERFILGQALVAEDRIERLQALREAAVMHGQRWRYRLTDGRGHSRFLSEHDLQQRARAKAELLLTKTKEHLTPEERQQMRQELLQQQLIRHADTLQKVRAARAADLASIEANLNKTSISAQPFLRQAAEIREKYEAAQLPLPTPVLTRTELAQLQERAIERGDAAKLRKLEGIRTALIAESGAPQRSNGEVSQLRAQHYVARSGLQTERTELKSFEETKHLRRWPLADNQSDPLQRSLAEIERALLWETDQAKFIGKRFVHWDDARRAQAQRKVVGLREQREMILTQIQERRAELTARVAQQSELEQMLVEMLAKEQERYRIKGQELPAPQFGERELKQLDAHAARRNEPELYQALARLERASTQSSKEEKRDAFIRHTSRAQARAILAEMSLREAERNLAEFRERREWLMLVVQDDGEREISVARLADIVPRAPLAQLFPAVYRHSEQYHQITTALEAHGTHLLEQRELAEANSTLLKTLEKEATEEYKRNYPDRQLPRPVFTPWEVGRLEFHAANERDPVQRARYEAIYREALADEQVHAANELSLHPKKFARAIPLEQSETGRILAPLSDEREEHRAQTWGRESAPEFEFDR